nr:MAG TPA: hypothetical protein [Inoviridae sp.]DAU71794.1 MAG TPA: hypothetical protein [Inoviridae sp.]
MFVLCLSLRQELLYNRSIKKASTFFIFFKFF